MLYPFQWDESLTTSKVHHCLILLTTDYSQQLLIYILIERILQNITDLAPPNHAVFSVRYR